MSLDDAKDLVLDLISTSFPTLKNRPVLFKDAELDEIAGCELTDTGLEIILNEEDFAQMSSQAAIGVIVHELCHLESDLAESHFKKWLRTRFPRLFSVDVAKMERDTDIMVIEKGFGKDLLAFQEYHDSIYEPYDESDGLTLKEIQAMVR